MTIIELSEVTDRDTRTEYYTKATNSAEFEDFKQMFEELSESKIDEARYQLLKGKGDDTPSVIVFRVVDGYTYELRGSFSNNGGVSFKLNVKQES